MRKEDQRRLERLLSDLMDKQDDVTHYNEGGLAQLCIKAQRERDEVRRRIVAFVEGLT